MSFASDVKKEISIIEVDNCCLKAELYFIIKLKGELVISKRSLNVIVQTKSNTIARKIMNLVKKLYNITCNISVKEQNHFDYRKIYIVEINDATKILFDLDILDDNYYKKEEVSKKIVSKECCKKAILRGAFIASGSINNPNNKNYHLEIVCNNDMEATFIQNIIEEVGITSNKILRDKGMVVYIKKAESIGDFLKYIGSNNMLFIFEDARIKKDLNNYVNRIMNCDVANEQKAIINAQKQLDDIKIILDNIPQNKIEQKLLDAIILRNNNPDDSLSQLSEKSEDEIGYYISKSGLSHRFKQIANISNEYKKQD